MAIFGIGVDIVEMVRVSKLYEKYPDKFPARILTDGELIELKQQSEPVLFLAKRFAAKEAASKALGTGFSKGVSFQDFEVQHDTNGRPELLIEGAASQIILDGGVHKIHLSISDEKNYAIANVVFEK